MADYLDELMKDVNQFKVEPTPKPRENESMLGKALRHGTRSAVEMGSDFLGAPADLAQTGLWALNKLGKGSDALKNKLGLGGILGTEEYDLPEKLPAPFPTSENIKKGVKWAGEKTLPDKYLEPTTEGEKFSDEFLGDVASLMSPIPKIGKIPFKRALKISGFSNLAKFGAKQLSAGEGTQTGVKMGSILAYNLLGAPWITKHMQGMYDIGHEEIKSNPEHTVSLKSMEPLLQDIEKEAKSGYLAEHKQKALDIVKQVRDKSKLEWVYNPETMEYIPQSKEALATGAEPRGHKMTPESHLPVSEVWEFKKDMNEILKDNREDYKFKAPVKRLVGGFKDVLADYGKKNPRFWDALTEADNIFGGLHEASGLNKFLQRHVSEKNLTSKVGMALLGYHNPWLAAKFGIGAMGARGLVQGFEALKNSSAIRAYYGNIMKSALKHDSKGVARNIAAFNKALEEEYPSNKLDDMSLEDIDKMVATF